MKKIESIMIQTNDLLATIALSIPSVLLDSVQMTEGVICVLTVVLGSSGARISCSCIVNSHTDTDR